MQFIETIDGWRSLCFRGKGSKDGKCTNYMATREKCQSCKACPWRPEEI